MGTDEVLLDIFRYTVRHWWLYNIIKSLFNYNV